MLKAFQQELIDLANESYVEGLRKFEKHIPQFIEDIKEHCRNKARNQINNTTLSIDQSHSLYELPCGIMENLISSLGLKCVVYEKEDKKIISINWLLLVN